MSNNDGEPSAFSGGLPESNEPIGASVVRSPTPPVEEPRPTVTIEDPDDPLRDTHFPFDLVLVFDDVAVGAKDYAENLYSDIVHDGLVACIYVKTYSKQSRRIFVGIGASDRFLHGVVQHYQFTEERTEARDHKGVCRIYAQNTRQRILLRYLKLRRYGGPHASFKWLQESGILLDYYLLHDPLEVRDLRRGFMRYVFLPRPQFIADVEEYFGEELAMYMAWLRTVILFAGPIAALYVIFFAFEIKDDYSSWSMAVAGYLAPIYLQFFHEYWKRQEKRLAFEFGTLDMEQTAEVREGYRGTQRMIRWKHEKRIRHEGEEEDTIIVKAGKFELPIQHTVPQQAVYQSPTTREARTAVAPQEDPFTVKVVQQLNFDALPSHVMERHYPDSKRWISYLFSIPTTLVFCVVVVVAIYAIDFLREVLSTAGSLSTEYSVAISVINGVVIVLLNTLYPIITFKLCEWENHRTQGSFEEAYIMKLFLFVFVNSYFPILLQVFKLYIVSADKLESQSKSERVQAIFIQLLTACISTVFVSNIQDIIVPFFLGPVMDKLRVWWSGKQRKDATEPITEASPASSNDLVEENEKVEKEGNFVTRKFLRMERPEHVFEHQMRLSPPQPVTTRFMGRIILLGFASIFASLMPLGMVFVFIDAVITTRVEVVRYLYLMRRMPARQVESIGGWRTCIQFIIVVAAVTNCLILSFRTESLVDWYGASGSFESRLTIFIASEHIVMFIVFAVEYLIPDTSNDIEQIKALQRYLVLKEADRLTYDPIDLQMPPHLLIGDNILEGDPSSKLCVQCHVELVPDVDEVRKFPCHHHIHEGCLNVYRNNATERQSDGTGGLVQCPSCDLDIDCRYFDAIVPYQKYTNVRYRCVEELANDRDSLLTSDALKILNKENASLVGHSAVFGLKQAFPKPGPAPTGRPPRKHRNDESFAVKEPTPSRTPCE